MKKIRLINQIHTDGAKQMALDEAILTSCYEGKSPPTLRFYRFVPPAITLGVHQSIRNFNLEKVKEKGFDLVRRITGGTSVLHKGDFVYSLVLPEDDLPDKILDVYNQLSEGLVRGFHYLGVKVSKKNFSSKKREDSCYLNNNLYDIVFDGRKLSGNALTRVNGWLMEQGTLIIEDNIRDLLDCQNLLEKEKERLYEKARKKAGCINEALGRVPSFSEIEDSIRKGFADLFLQEGYSLEEGELTDHEKNLAEKLYNEKYSTIEWRDLR